ncbi:ESPN protein, partial [Dromas ardeola]|nr:ESPN protein [Dromas ardeola]
TSAAASPPSPGPPAVLSPMHTPRRQQPPHFLPQDTDNSGATILHLAARFGHHEVIDWLLRFGGSDPTAATDTGALPVHYAAAKGDFPSLRLLLGHCPSTLSAQTKTGATPLYLACQEGHLEIIQYLVQDCGADPHARAHDGMTPLHAAAQMGHNTVIVWLMSFTTVSLSEQDAEGATAMHFAASRGHAKVLSWLLLHGGEITTDSWGGTPLHDAAENGELECCQILVVNGADLSVRDQDGYTAADLADYNGHGHCAQYLRTVENMSVEHRVLSRDPSADGECRQPDSGMSSPNTTASAPQAHFELLTALGGDSSGVRPPARDAGMHRGAGVQPASGEGAASQGQWCSGASVAPAGPAPLPRQPGHRAAPSRPARGQPSQPHPRHPSDATGATPSGVWAAAQAVTRAAGSGVAGAAGVGWHSRCCQELRGLSRACTGKRGAAPWGGPGAQRDVVGSGPPQPPAMARDTPSGTGSQGAAMARALAEPSTAGDGGTWAGGAVWVLGCCSDRSPRGSQVWRESAGHPATPVPHELMGVPGGCCQQGPYCPPCLPPGTKSFNMMSPTGDNSELLAEIKAGKSLKPTPQSKGFTTIFSGSGQAGANAESPASSPSPTRTPTPPATPEAAGPPRCLAGG